MKQSTKNKIGLDPAPVNPITGQLYYDRTVSQLMVFDGVTWKSIEMTPIQYCVICEVADWSHNNLFGGHPFCSNNLELLEWKSEESERAVS